MTDAGHRDDTGGATAPLPNGPKPGERDTAFFPDPMIDHLLRAVVTLTMELSVTRERLSTLETLLATSGSLNKADADDYAPGDDEAADRGRQRNRLIGDVLGPIVSRLSRAV